MALKIGPIQIFVSDLERAVKFYKKLGFKLSRNYPEWKCAYMRFGKLEFDIGVPNKSWGNGWQKYKKLVGKSAGLFFETDDIGKNYIQLTKKKVRFTQPPKKFPWGEIKAIFEDPDGNEFAIIQVQ